MRFAPSHQRAGLDSGYPQVHRHRAGSLVTARHSGWHRQALDCVSFNAAADVMAPGAFHPVGFCTMPIHRREIMAVWGDIFIIVNRSQDFHDFFKDAGFMHCRYLCETGGNGLAIKGLLARGQRALKVRPPMCLL